ncbi:MAG: hypothetical protein WCD07_08910 [Burkholderiales bacterium]
MQVKEHYKNTKKLIGQISPDEVATWLLEQGYFPESYVLPPSFKVSEFKLGKKPFNKKILALAKRQLINISYPKTLLTSRTFGIQHPWNYHDIVLILKNNWSALLEHLFHKNQKSYSYSFPIPVSAEHQGS